MNVNCSALQEILTDDFLGLRNLQNLNIQRLTRIERFESKALVQINHLSSLSMETWPKIENFSNQLCSLLANLNQLRILKLRVQDVVLDDQLLCVSNRKIRHLELTGKKLKVIEKNAFSKFTKHPDLLLKISGTEVEELPSGIFSNMHHISYLSIDLRDNMLTYLSPEIFYGNITTWKNVGTTLVTGE